MQEPLEPLLGQEKQPEVVGHSQLRGYINFWKSITSIRLPRRW